MPHVKLSIIISVFNGQKYIDDCLNSLLKQSFTDFEIIIVDDGSTDNSKSLLEMYQLSFDKFSYYYQSNSGQGFAKNFAIGQAVGEFILFLDIDDYLLENALAQLPIFSDEQPDALHFRWKYFDEINQQELIPANMSTIQEGVLEGSDCESILKNRVYYCVNMVYSRTFLQSNNITFGEGYIYEDFEFYAQVASLANKIIFVSDELYIVRLNNTSSTKSDWNTDKHYTDFLMAVENTRNKTIFRKEISTFYLNAHFLNRAYLYYQKRIPPILKKSFLIKFFDMIKFDSYPSKLPLNRYSILINFGIIKNEKYWLFILIMNIFKSPLMKVLFKINKRIHNYLR